MKKSFLMFVLALLVAAPLSALNGNMAQAGAPLQANTAVRGQSAMTVYWYANDGKRYVFPNAATYFTWFPSFDSVRTITDADLISIPLGGNVTYRPGAKLVKINTDPRTYAVAKGGVLRHVTSESLASQLYGSDWRTDVHDVPDVYFTNYTVGTPIYNASDFNVSNEYNGVFTPSDSLKSTGQNNGLAFTLEADRTSITSGQPVVLTARTNFGRDYLGQLAAAWIEIRDAKGMVLKRCAPIVTTCNVTVYPVKSNSQTSVLYHAYTDEGLWAPLNIYFTGSNQANDLSIWTDKTSINSGDAITVSAWSSQTFNVSRIEVRDERDNSLVFTCYSVQNCSQSRTFFRRNTSESTFRLYAQLKDWSGAVLRTAYTPAMTFNGTTSGQNTLTASLNKTTINSGETVTVTAHASNLSEPLHRVKIELYTYWTYHLIETCYGSATCSFQTHASKWEDGHDAFFVRLVTTDGHELARTDLPKFTFLNATSGSGDNRINGLVLNADRTNINAGERVRLTANAFNSGTWSYAGNRIDIVDAHRGTIVKTCYDVSTCVVDVYPQAQASTNLTAQYQARIYDRNGVLAMSQYSPVIYFTSYAGGTNSALGTGLITYAPTDALHPNRNVYLTATFSNSNIAMNDAQVRIYTEQSSTPIAVCDGAYNCSVSYPTGSSPMTTRIYAQLSNRYSVGTYAETPRMNLTTTW